jgi:hypothetical protein
MLEQQTLQQRQRKGYLSMKRQILHLGHINIITSNVQFHIRSPVLRTRGAFLS